MLFTPAYKILSAFFALVATAGLTIASSAPPAAAPLHNVSGCGHACSQPDTPATTTPIAA